MFHHKVDPFFFSFLSFDLPLLDFSLQLQFLLGPSISLIFFLINLHLDIFQLSFFLAKLILSVINLIFKLGVLFEDEIVFQLKIFSSSESDSGPVKILLDSIAIILKSIDFSAVEIEIVFGGGIAADSLGYLLLQLPLDAHRYFDILLLKINLYLPILDWLIMVFGR